MRFDFSISLRIIFTKVELMFNTKQYPLMGIFLIKIIFKNIDF